MTIKRNMPAQARDQSKGRAKQKFQFRGLAVSFHQGALSGIHYKGIEVLRGISFLVRDENWGTCPVAIRSIKASKTRNQLTISYSAVARNDSAKLHFHAEVTLRDRQLEFSASARPDTDFRTNRAGFVVLHPIIGVAGMPLVVTHTDGSKERARFPLHINPGQPFFEIRALEHAPAAGLKAHVLMEGNKFEMEDQRNWTDASYKTYVCSLLDPWPYTLKGGKTFEQKITLSLIGEAKDRISKRSKTPSMQVMVPEIGISILQDQARKAVRCISALKKLSPRHLTCALNGGDLDAACRDYATLSLKTGIPITLEIVLPAQAPAMTEMAEVARAVDAAGLEPRRVVVTQFHDLKSFQPTDKRPWGPSYEEMANAARKHFPGAAIGGGMASYFTELNRKRPPQGLFDFITHSICPIVHDASDEAVMQTLESLPFIFATTKSFIGKTPYHLGPSSIGARMNPYGTALAKNPKHLLMCLAPNDPRQFEKFAIEWNSGVILAAAKAGVESVTLSELTGARGLFDKSQRESPLFKHLARMIALGGKRVVMKSGRLVPDT